MIRKRCPLSVLRGVQFARCLEALDRALVVLVLEGRPADPEVRLRGRRALRIIFKKLAKRGRHPFVVLLLAEDERLLLQGELPLRSVGIGVDNLIEILERRVVFLVLLECQPALGDGRRQELGFPGFSRCIGCRS